MPGIVFAFDLDGTVTTEEILPRLAERLGLRPEMERLTRLTLLGEMDFEASFRQRVDMLRGLSLEEAQAVVAATPLDPSITKFIQARRERCFLATGNLDCWVQPLVERLGCKAFTSTAVMRDGKPTVQTVLDKAEAVRELARTGAKIIAVGESAGDIPLFAAADVGIAYAGVHEPAPILLPLAQYRVDSGEELCNLLEKLEAEFLGKK